MGSTELTKHRLYIATADQSEDTKRIIEKLQKKFPAAQYTSALSIVASRHRSNIYIAVGPAALRALLSQSADGVIVSVFTSSQAVREIVEAAPDSRRATVTAVYADPSPVEQLRLIATIYKRPVHVAVLVRDKNTYLVPLLRQAATQSNIRLSIEAVSSEENINRILDRIKDANVVLALPDSKIYNPETVRNILITTYRRDQGVLGFSVAFVKAGALATTYSDVDDIVSQVEEMLNEINVSGRIPEAQFPKYFDVAVNESVARSLNLVIDDNVKKYQSKATQK
ncbi:MAG: hypothetical protein V4568_02030 [Pseudomonadota bacterium]